MTEHEDRIADQDGAPDVTKVDLNAADEEELCQLPGIGPVLAARVVNYRIKVSPFNEPRDIVSVPGITEGMYQLMAEHLTVGSQPGADARATLWPVSDEEPDTTTWQTINADSQGHSPTAWDAEELTPPETAAEEAITSDPEAPRSEKDAIAAGPPGDFDQQVASIEYEQTVEQRVPSEGPPVIAYTTPPQGGHWGRLVVFGLAGAVLGATLALAFLLMVNGTLNFQMASSKALNSEALRLNDEIGELAVDLSQLRGRVDVLQDLSMRLEKAQTDVSQLGRDVGRMQSEVELLREDMTLMQEGLAAVTQHSSDLDQTLSGLQAQLSAMGAHLDGLRSDLDILSQESQRFGVFLAGLRQLLNQPLEPQPDATPIRPLLSTPTARPTSVLRPQITVIPLATPTP